MNAIEYLYNSISSNACSPSKTFCFVQGRSMPAAFRGISPRNNANVLYERRRPLFWSEVHPQIALVLLRFIEARTRSVFCDPGRTLFVRRSIKGVLRSVKPAASRVFFTSDTRAFFARSIASVIRERCRAVLQRLNISVALPAASRAVYARSNASALYEH